MNPFIALNKGTYRKPLFRTKYLYIGCKAKIPSGHDSLVLVGDKAEQFIWACCQMIYWSSYLERSHLTVWPFRFAGST